VAPLKKKAKSRKPLNFKEVQGFFFSKKTQKKVSQSMFIIANSVTFFDPLKKATDYVFYSLINSYLRSYNLHSIS